MTLNGQFTLIKINGSDQKRVESCILNGDTTRKLTDVHVGYLFNE